MLGNFTPYTGCNGGKKALSAWKNMKLPLFQWSRKSSREKCQQPRDAGFCCCGRHGLWFPHVSFLSHYASSFHPIKHKHRLQSKTQATSWYCSFWEKQTEEGNRGEDNREKGMVQDKAMGRSDHECMCVQCGFTVKMDLLAENLYVSASLCLSSFSPFCVSLWRAAVCFCFVLIQWHEQTVVQLIYDWWCLQTWSMAGHCRNPSWTWAVLALVVLATCR